LELHERRGDRYGGGDGEKGERKRKGSTAELQRTMLGSREDEEQLGSLGRMGYDGCFWSWMMAALHAVPSSRSASLFSAATLKRCQWNLRFTITPHGRNTSSSPIQWPTLFAAPRALTFQSLQAKSGTA